MSFLKKKNLKAKKGKQKWRKNLDITELQANLAQEPILIPILKKPNQKKPKFFIDSEPTKTIKKTLDPNRFKKKPVSGIISKSDQKVLRKKLRSSLLRGDPKPKIEENIEEIAVLSKNRLELPKEKVLKNPLPAAGQSYNPSFKDHKSLLQEVVNTEIAKTDIKHAVSNKLKKKTEKPTISSEKAFNHQFNLLKKYKREIKEKDKEIEARKKIKDTRKELEKALFSEGKVLNPKRIGKSKYQDKIKDFKLSSELPENLRKIDVEGNNVRDAFDNIYRKGMIELGNPYAARKKIRKLPKYKFHQGKNDGDFEENTLGTSFNIYNY